MKLGPALVDLQNAHRAEHVAQIFSKISCIVPIGVLAVTVPLSYREIENMNGEHPEGPRVSLCVLAYHSKAAISKCFDQLR